MKTKYDLLMFILKKTDKYNDEAKEMILKKDINAVKVLHSKVEALLDLFDEIKEKFEGE